MRRTWSVLSLLCALIALPTPAAAQLGDDLGRMWLSFSETVLAQSREVKPGDDFIFYIRTEIDFGTPGQNGTDGLLAWEAQVVLPPEVTVTNRTIYGDPINCLDDSCGNDFSLGYSACIKGDETTDSGK